MNEEYKYIYITLDNRLHYIGLNEELDPEINEVGSTYEDYMAGKWVLLTQEQIDFHNENPNASVREVYNMAIDEPAPPVTPSEEELLRDAINNKMSEIRLKDGNSNKFFVSVTSGGEEVGNYQFWMDKDLRNSLLNVTLPSLKANGDTTTKLWSDTVPPQSIEVPIDWALNCIPVIEVYAKNTYDIMQENIARVYSAKTAEEVNSIDINENYPPYLTFELNIDNNE